ncbi:MAG: hypothetical protein ACYCO9_20355 [Streptosporangiaceae bacterium]
MDGEKRLAYHGRWGHPGERQDVPVQVGLIGVAAVGRDSRRVLVGGQGMDGVVEADHWPPLP